ncbi:hypothetical protein QJS10_CPB19g01290 [Acorus calamus]|uniref:Uncharacterized protein n=1 Tax=Acorus calamus TaxID=4465 RepID=A0AAV9CEN6_ACOCL|nr:hypothetical protein QJS10_CPB19g01290 [Acorus calamus]
MSDIRRWFMKQHDKGSGNASSKPETAAAASKAEKDTLPQKPLEKPSHGAQEGSGRRKTSKYFSTPNSEDQSTKQKPKEESTTERTPAKRKAQKVIDESHDVKPPSAKKPHKVRMMTTLSFPKRRNRLLLSVPQRN